MEQVSITIKPYTSEEECAKATAAAAALLAGSDSRKSVFASRNPKPRPKVAKKLVKTNDLPKASGDEWVLVVDDNDVLIEVCCQMLEHLGYNVITATGGNEALEIFRVHSSVFDLVISDVEMPDMNGAELTRELLAIRPGLPIMLFSGYCEWMDVGKAQAIGACEFRLKPMPLVEMAKCVRQLIDKAA